MVSEPKPNGNPNFFSSTSVMEDNSSTTTPRQLLLGNQRPRPQTRRRHFRPRAPCSRPPSPLRSSFRSSSMMSSLDVQSVRTDMTLHVIIMGTSSSLVSSGPDGYLSAGLELCHQLSHYSMIMNSLV
jgi:hypothetical protein